MSDKKKITIVLGILFGIALIAFIGYEINFMVKNKDARTVTYNEFEQMLNDPSSGITSVVYSPSDFNVTFYKGEEKYYTTVPQDDFERNLLNTGEGNFDVEIKTNTIRSILTGMALPLCFICLSGLLYFVFGRKLFPDDDDLEDQEEESEVSFNDVIGNAEIKEELIGYQKIIESGGEVPGILFYGPAGLGKTLIGKAFAAELGERFYYLNASDFASSRYVGTAARKLKKFFDAVLNDKRSGGVIFIDEIDSIGTKRADDGSSAMLDNRITVNKLLNCIDSAKDAGLIVVGSTNDFSSLDSALLRRLNRKIKFSYPRKEDVLPLFFHFVKKRGISLNSGFDLTADQLTGLSPAQIETLVLQSDVKMRLADACFLTEKMVEDAATELMLDGKVIKQKHCEPEDEHEKFLTCVHEASHAVIAELLIPGSVLRVTVSPATSGEQGFVKVVYPQVKNFRSLRTTLLILYAGFMGETILYKDSPDLISFGSHDDICKAKELVEEYWDYICYEFTDGVLIGGSDPSEDLLRMYIHSIQEETRALLIKNRDVVNLIANELKRSFEGELNGDEIREIMSKKV